MNLLRNRGNQPAVIFPQAGFSPQMLQMLSCPGTLEAPDLLPAFASSFHGGVRTPAMSFSSFFCEGAKPFRPVPPMLPWP